VREALRGERDGNMRAADIRLEVIVQLRNSFRVIMYRYLASHRNIEAHFTFNETALDYFESNRVCQAVHQIISYDNSSQPLWAEYAHICFFRLIIFGINNCRDHK